MFRWSEKKNTVLQKNRGISFEYIAKSIKSGYVVDIVKNQNYENQKNFHVYIQLHDYVYVVPFEIRDNYIWLVTAYPSRKATRKLKKRGVRWMKSNLSR